MIASGINGMEAGDRQARMIRHIPRMASGEDLSQLFTLLRQIKTRFPGLIDTTILLEPDIELGTIVKVTNTVGIAGLARDDVLQSSDPYPGISIDNAAADTAMVAVTGRVRAP